MNKYTLKNVRVSTLEAYLSLPKEDREMHVWFWPGPWYRTPYAMSLDMDSFESGKIEGEWGKFHCEMKKRYPVQFFFRDYQNWPPVSYFNMQLRYFSDNYYYPFKCFFNSRNKHIQKQIPNTWKCSGEIIKDVLYSMFEKEYLPNKMANWKSGYSDAEKPGGHWYEKALEFDACYKWFNEDRKELESKLEMAWENLPRGKNLDYYQKYGVTNELEQQIEDGDNKYLSWIVVNRNILD